MHSPSATQRAKCISLPHGTFHCRASAWLTIWARSREHTKCSCVHQAAPAKAHLVQGVENEGVPERQDGPGQGSRGIRKHNLRGAEPFTEQRASPCSAGSARLRRGQLRDAPLWGYSKRTAVTAQISVHCMGEGSSPCAEKLSGGTPTGGPAHRQPVSGRGGACL